MKNKLTFMLDMDGVCCDWVTSALKTIGKPELVDKWTPGVKSLTDFTEVSYHDIWEIIDAKGSEWWRDLKEYPWFWDLYKTLNDNGDVVFCSSPCWEAASLKGKVEWLQDRFGKSYRDYILTNRKYYVAKQNSILVDDNDTQCRNFREYGGRTILFPQLWNDTAFNEEFQKDRIAYVKSRINFLENE